MIPRWLKLLLVVILPCYVLYLVAAKTPATWAAWAMQKAVPGLWLSGVNGSFWRGSAEFGQLDLGDSMLLALGEVRWTLRPWSLITLRACGDLQTFATGQSIAGEFCHSMHGSTELENMTVDLPVALANALLPVQIGGQASLQVITASVDRQLRIRELDAKLSWREAKAHNGESWLKLGSFGANLSESEQGGIQANIFDLQGPFKLDANASWLLKEGWQVAAQITPTESAPPMLVQGLQVVGEEKTKGTYSLSWP